MTTVSVRNVDKDLFKEFKLRAKQQDLNIGDALNEAMRLFLQEEKEKRKSLLDIEPWDFGPGTERLSEEIDEVVYGPRTA